MGPKICLDANVLIDLYSQSRTGHTDAATLLAKVVDGTVKAAVTPAIIHMTTYILRKEYSREWLREMWKSMANTVEIIELNHTFALQAIHSNFADLEDALQYYAALQHRCTHFISSDKNFHNAASTQLPVLSAPQFLSFLS